MDIAGAVALRSSEEFEIYTANRESSGGLAIDIVKPGGLIVERVSECFTPHFTPDELRPLGLRVEEFQNDYVATLMLPRPSSDEAQVIQPSLILTRRPDWDEMQQMFNHLYRDRVAGDPEFLSPEEFLVRIDLEDKHFALSPEQLFEFIPEPEEWGDTPMSDNTYFSVHKPRLTIPVTMGFFDRDLITGDVRSRWPFLPGDVGL